MDNLDDVDELVFFPFLFLVSAIEHERKMKSFQPYLADWSNCLRDFMWGVIHLWS